MQPSERAPLNRPAFTAGYRQPPRARPSGGERRGMRTLAVLVGVLVLLSVCGGAAQTSRDIEGTWNWDSADVSGRH